jgi:hypothetical protein
MRAPRADPLAEAEVRAGWPHPRAEFTGWLAAGSH